MTATTVSPILLLLLNLTGGQALRNDSLEPVLEWGAIDQGYKPINVAHAQPTVYLIQSSLSSPGHELLVLLTDCGAYEAAEAFNPSIGIAVGIHDIAHHDTAQTGLDELIMQIHFELALH